VIDWKSQGILFWKTCMNPVGVTAEELRAIIG